MRQVWEHSVFFWHTLYLQSYLLVTCGSSSICLSNTERWSVGWFKQNYTVSLGNQNKESIIITITTITCFLLHGADEGSYNHHICSQSSTEQKESCIGLLDIPHVRYWKRYGQPRIIIIMAMLSFMTDIFHKC